MQALTNQPSTKFTRQEKFLKTWALFQHELLYICWAVMDVALLTPFALVLMNWARYWPPGILFLGLLLVMLLAFNLARLMSALYLPPSSQQVVMAVGLLLIVFFSLRTLLHQPQSLFDLGWIGEFFASLNEPGNVLWQRDVVLFVLVVLMWARGLQMANREFTISRIGLRLRVGGLMIAPLVVWVSNYALLWDTTQFVLLFFLAGLTAVALTRAEQIAQDESGYSASLTPRWLTLIFATGLLIIFMAGIVAALIGKESATAVAGFLSPLWLALTAMVITAVAVIIYLLTPLIIALEWLVAGIQWNWLTQLMLAMQQYAQRIQGQEIELPTAEGEEVIIEGGMSQGGQIITILLAISIILVVALLLGRMYRRATVVGRAAQIGHIPSVALPEDESLMHKLLARLGLWRNWYAAASIRRIYRQMLVVATAVGHPKLDAETPYEYLPTLAKVWPQHQQDTRLITEAYIKVRYGETPETQAELDEILQAWQRLEQVRSEK
jgi:hypothetical protein